MSKISLAPDASGTGIFTIASPGTSTNRTLTLPDDTGTLALTSAALTGTTDSATPFETALGTDAGAVNTGVNNVFVGFEAGNDNTSGTNNTALGYQALDVNTTGASNTAVGSSSLGANTTGADNTAVGKSALDANTTGTNNVAMGVDALGANTTGANNAAFGYLALNANTTPAGNNAFGRSALLVNTTGANNIAVGNFALAGNTTGSRNTAVGNQALEANTTADNNTAVGADALKANTTGADNTAVGYAALDANTTGIRNTAVGNSAGEDITTGVENVCIGYFAGAWTSGITTGNYNTHIGTNTKPSAVGVDDELVINAGGAGATGKGTNTGFINAGGGGVYQGNNSSSWSTTSDQRLKKNIVDNTEGLDKVSAIRVRNFEYRTEEEITDLPSHTVINKTGVQLGVIAQELQQVCPDCVKEETTGVLSVDSDNIFWHMVNAIKELSAQVTALQAEVNTLKGN
jgi:trimeric autotransporter adhesin